MLTHLLDQTKPAKTQRHTHKHSCWLQFRGHTQEPTLLRRTGDKLSCSKNSFRLNSKATRNGAPGLQRSSACPHRGTRFCLEQISDWRRPYKHWTVPLQEDQTSIILLWRGETYCPVPPSGHAQLKFQSTILKRNDVINIKTHWANKEVCVCGLNKLV